MQATWRQQESTSKPPTQAHWATATPPTLGCLATNEPRISPSRCELNDQIDLAHLRLDQLTLVTSNLLLGVTTS